MFERESHVGSDLKKAATNTVILKVAYIGMITVATRTLLFITTTYDHD